MFKNRCDGCPRVSNYFIGHEHIPREAQTFINTTFRLVEPHSETEHFAELQFALQDFLTIKGIQHEYYEVSRAGSIDELLARPLGGDHQRSLLLPPSFQEIDFTDRLRVKILHV